MTLDDIKAMPDDFITPATAASVMRMDTGRLIQYARDGALPFPVVCTGNRVKIPRIGFLRAFGVEAEERTRRDGIEKKLDEILTALHELIAIQMGLMVHIAPEIAMKMMEEKEGTPQ